MADEPLTPHAARNRAAWDSWADEYQALHGAQLEASGGLAWGVWQIAESQLNGLGDVTGLDVLEYGCGAAQWAVALAAAGARVTGLDNSARQLEMARAAITAAGVDVELVHASAEDTPFDSASFDVVFCDHGAMTFCDPRLTVPECARLLRTGGLLAFSALTPLIELTYPEGADNPTDRLVNDYYGLHEIVDDDMTAFTVPYGEWIALFRANGFMIEDLLELRPSPDATSSYRDATDLAWARRWPMEQIWRVRREA